MTNIELSEEMQEAIRILREDGQIGAFQSMTQSNQAIIERLDKIESDRAEEKANAAKQSETPKETTPEITPVVVPDVIDGPPPPPRNESTPEPVEKQRKNWWDHYSNED
jgi:hypothetical protein